MVNQVLFVYGTLRPGESNEDILGMIEGTFSSASIRGFHYPDGWLQHFPYPGVDLDDKGDVIPGCAFFSSELHKHWGRLDAFEGSHYKRVITTVRLDDGTTVDGYVYVINRTD